LHTPVLAVASILLRVGRLRFLQDLVDDLPQPRLVLEHPFVAHRLVLRRMRFHLRPVDRHLSQLHQLRFLAQVQNLHEQRPERVQVAPPELADPRVVRVAARREHPEGHVLVRPSLDLPRRPHAHAVPVQEQRQHHHRVVRRVAPLLALVRRLDGRQVERLHQIQHEVGEVVLGQPLLRRRWQQVALGGLVRLVGLRHAARRSRRGWRVHL
jgi:hypothetical protein